MADTIRRDRVTWVAYVMIAWFAYLQAAPGLVVPHLRDELDLSYSIAGLHIAAFAAGSALAGLATSWLDRALGRWRLLWGAALLLGVGTVGLTAGGVVLVTVGSTLVMGCGGGLLLGTVQAALADRHGELRTVALAEANVAASVSYLGLIGVFALAAAVHAGWRAALLVCLLVPVVTWWANRRLRIDAAPPPPVADAHLPGVFWVAATVLMCATAAEWCITSWGATFVEETSDVSVDAAVAVMAGYFGGVVVGRVLGSRLARRHDPARLFGIALGVAAVGFGVLWPAQSPAQAVVGLALLGIGLGNLFPMGLSLAIALAPGQSGAASGRAVMMTSLSVLLAPPTIGALADASSLKLAFGIVPVLLVLAAAGLRLVRRPGTLARAGEGEPRDAGATRAASAPTEG